MIWEIGKVVKENTLSALKLVTRGQQQQLFAAAFLSGDPALAQSHMHTWTTCRQVRALQWKRKREKGKAFLALGLDLL